MHVRCVCSEAIMPFALFLLQRLEQRSRFIFCDCETLFLYLCGSLQHKNIIAEDANLKVCNVRKEYVYCFLYKAFFSAMQFFFETTACWFLCIVKSKYCVQRCTQGNLLHYSFTMLNYISIVDLQRDGGARTAADIMCATDHGHIFIVHEQKWSYRTPPRDYYCFVC